MKVVIATVVIFEVSNILFFYQKNSWIHPLDLKDIGLYLNLFRIIKKYHVFSRFLTIIDLLLILNNSTIQIILNPFTEKYIGKVIQNADSNSALSNDIINMCMLQFGKSIIKLLEILYNKRLERGCLPKE